MSISTNKPLVIVTGSSGYIGSAVITALASDYQLVGFDREAAPHPPAVAECVCIDLTKEKSLETALERVKTVHGKSIASVIHLAAYFDLSGEPSDAYEQITLGGTRRLLECLQPFDVEQFVFVSTMLVHAPNESGEAINESSPIDPKLPYRESKALTEQIVKEQAGDIPVVILRPAGIYDEECHSAFLAEQISGIYEQRYISHFYPGELSVGQPYLHLRDLTNAIHRTIDMRAELSRETVMLLAEPEVLGYGELQRLIGEHRKVWGRM